MLVYYLKLRDYNEKYSPQICIFKDNHRLNFILQNFINLNYSIPTSYQNFDFLLFILLVYVL